MKILIADDHAIVRKGLKQLLLEEYPSAKIEEVADGESLSAISETDLPEAISLKTPNSRSESNS